MGTEHDQLRADPSRKQWRRGESGSVPSGPLNLQRADDENQTRVLKLETRAISPGKSFCPAAEGVPLLTVACCWHVPQPARGEVNLVAARVHPGFTPAELGGAGNGLPEVRQAPLTGAARSAFGSAVRAPDAAPSA